MPAITKAFGHTLPFQTPNGTQFYPIVVVTMTGSLGRAVSVPLLFDTGASVITLRHELHSLVGARSWTKGQKGTSATAGGKKRVTYYQFHADVSFLGKTINCPVNLMRMQVNPLWMGLCGRAAFMEQYGFGFWESARELYVTTAP
jgi:hypothetical protein